MIEDILESFGLIRDDCSPSAPCNEVEEILQNFEELSDENKKDFLNRIKKSLNKS